jgi:hypothetical protein
MSAVVPSGYILTLKVRPVTGSVDVSTYGVQLCRSPYRLTHTHLPLTLLNRIALPHRLHFFSFCTVVVIIVYAR